MRTKLTHSSPSWALSFHCTNPWCLLLLNAEEGDIKYGPYPDDLQLQGDGFYLRCPGCGRHFSIHWSMLFEPLLEKTRKRIGKQDVWRG